MAIRLVTGRPGHGKTLLAVDQLLNEILPTLPPERRVFSNINGLKLDRVEVLDDPRKWMDLPDGSFVIVDEAQRPFPVRNMASEMPDYISAFQTHRHRGMDFMVITQAPDLIDPGLRKLIDRHTHVRRPYGAGYHIRYDYDNLNMHPEPSLQVEDALKNRRKFDPRVFQHYTSATMHTVQPRFPWLKLAPLALFPISACLVAYVLYSMANPDVPNSAKGALGDRASSSSEAAAFVPGAPPVRPCVLVLGPAAGRVLVHVPRHGRVLTGDMWRLWTNLPQLVDLAGVDVGAGPMELRNMSTGEVRSDFCSLRDLQPSDPEASL